MTPVSNQYETLLRHVFETGTQKTDRTGVGTRSVFGYQMRFDLTESFPLVTTKKLHLRSIIHELLWFLNGDSNVKYLHDNKVTIWDEWADKDGNLGPIYGVQWRSWPAPDGEKISTTPTADASLCAPGMSQTSTKWRCRRVTVSFSFMWLTANSPANSISEAATFFWAFPLTSRVTHF